MTSSAEERLAELGLKLPAPPPAVANYVGAVRSGNLVFVSGHGPYRDGQYQYIGKVDSQVPVEDAYKSAQLTILNALASLKAEIGSLDRVRRVVKLFGMVNSDLGFGRQPDVISASDVLVHIFGDRGKHARSAVGLGALPMGISIEIEMVVEIEAE
jgi:enamine deaminase RidA (YjgF/YER057c/UK114 family)